MTCICRMFFKYNYKYFHKVGKAVLANKKQFIRHSNVVGLSLGHMTWRQQFRQNYDQCLLEILTFLFFLWSRKHDVHLTFISISGRPAEDWGWGKHKYIHHANIPSHTRVCHLKQVQLKLPRVIILDWKCSRILENHISANCVKYSVYEERNVWKQPSGGLWRQAVNSLMSESSRLRYSTVRGNWGSVRAPNQGFVQK